MIASRQIAFGKAVGGNKLPDGVVPIEYLQSTGMQYIDTGIYAVNDIVVEGSVIIADYTPNLPARGWVIIGTDYTGSGYTFVIRQPNRESSVILHAMFGGWWTSNPLSGSLDAGVVTTFRFERATKKFFVNGKPITTSNPSDFSQHKILIGKNMNQDFAETPSLKISSIKLYIGDNLVRDYIPVRVGSVGYMYDRVSGQLFGNSGTGAFVLGADLIDYTAKDYIQDGLVALVDGIDNAGWGKHTDELKYVNLVTGEQFTLPNNGNAVWGEDCLKILESGDQASGLQTGFSFSARTLGITSEAQEYTIECALRAYDTNFSVVSFDGAFGRVLGTPSSDAFQGSVSSAYLPDSNYFQWSVNGDIRNKANSAIVQENFEGFFWNNREIYAGSRLRFGHSVNLVCKSDIHCARIYNRALTAEEVAYNYNIDRARFGL